MKRKLIITICLFTVVIALSLMILNITLFKNVSKHAKTACEGLTQGDSCERSYGNTTVKGICTPKQHGTLICIASIFNKNSTINRANVTNI